MSSGIKHPAKFSESIVQVLFDAFSAENFPDPIWILDPFAGVGNIHQLREIGHFTIGIEIEPEWAGEHEWTLRGDAHSLPFPDESFDAICTSPCYGNRMSDNFQAKDDSRRHTYRAYLGREVDDNSAGKLQWGDKYKEFHATAWREAIRVLKPGGTFVLNTSNHIRAGEEQEVTQWHSLNMLYLGLAPVHTYEIDTPRNRHGANADARVDHETVTVWRKP